MSGGREGRAGESLPILNTVRLALHDLLDVLESKQLQHQGQIVGVEQKLCQVLEFQNI